MWSVVNLNRNKQEYKYTDAQLSCNIKQHTFMVPYTNKFEADKTMNTNDFEYN